jgi:hypothetical protein
MININNFLRYADSTPEINNIISYLDNNNFDAEDKFIEDIINKDYYNSKNSILLEYYIDTYRTLMLLYNNADALLEKEKEDILGFHHTVTKIYENQNSNNELIDKMYKIQMDKFISYNEENDDYLVKVISDVDSLNWEGRFMNHCIATYKNYIAQQEYVPFIFVNKKNNYERLTLGCHLKKNKLVFNQLKNHSNFPASNESRVLVKKYCDKKGIEINENSYDLKV